jgi:hypothetical protein
LDTKKKDIQDLRFENQKINDIGMEKEVKKSFIEYAMSVIISRALPDVRDGMKPGQRRVIYAMYEDHLTHDKPFRKSATTVGNVLGRYHPHGDSSVYGTMVRMAQPFSLRYPLVEGHGNFGSVDGDPPAAYRYTEARLDKIANEMTRDLLHAGLGVTVSGRRVSVHRAEVTLTLDQRMAHIEGLRQVYHGAVHRAVTVRMVATQHRTDGGSRLAEGLVVGQMILVHGVQHAALTRLHAVADVGQGAGDDDRHGILDEGFLHLMLHIHVYDLLVFKEDALVFSLQLSFSLFTHACFSMMYFECY